MCTDVELTTYSFISAGGPDGTVNARNKHLIHSLLYTDTAIRSLTATCYGPAKVPVRGKFLPW